MIERVHVRELAARIRDITASDPPRTLPVLLGAGCAEAAGVPSYAVMARETLPKLVASKRVPHAPSEGAPDAEWVEAFKGYLGGLNRVQRYKVLEPFYRALPVPSFYRDLADLVVAGFVDRVLTTNVDSLLEQALDRAGLRAGTGYEIIVLGSLQPRPSVEGSVLTLVKLHGDLGEELLPVGPDEIGKVLHEQRSKFRSQLLDELIVVGHRLSGSEPEPVNDWLWRSSGAPLWWATPDPPEADPGPLGQLAETRPVRCLIGSEQGTPGGLFARLTFELLGLPALRAADVVAEDCDDDELEVEFHRSELVKTKTTAHDLQEQVVPGVRDSALAAELAEQHRRSEAQEAQLTAVVAGASGARPLREAADAVGKLADEISRLDAGQSAVEFLRTVAGVIRRQAAADPPDRILVQAALVGAQEFAQTFGDDLSSATRDGLSDAVANVSRQQTPPPHEGGVP